MNGREAFQVLGIDETKEERVIKNAYREKLAVTNPEDDPEGFKRLRNAYDTACRLARQEDKEEEPPKDETPSGLWVERAAGIYGNIRSRQDLEAWKELFRDECFLSLEEEENCRMKLLRFLMDHFRLPDAVWTLLNRKLSIVEDAAALRERFPADFVRYLINKCERGEDVEFDQFQGAEDADYDLFLQYYDRCWQALQEGSLEQAKQNITDADALEIRHPVMEICRAELLARQEQPEEGIRLLEELWERYPRDGMIGYNTAEALWRQGPAKEDSRRKAAEIYRQLKEDNDTHYMANVRLTEWYYDQKEYRQAKKCAEKVLAAGGDEAFMALLGKVNAQIEKQLEAEYRKGQSWDPALELCWCYLQDGKISRGIRLALTIEKQIPPQREAEYNGLLAKLYVEEAEYETAVTMSRLWEEALEKKLVGEEGEEKEKDLDRLKQARLIRMQSFHNLGFQNKTGFEDAVREGESVLAGNVKDIGVLLELAQIYTEMGEYEKCEELARKLVEDYQIYAAYATSLEAYRRQLNASGVVRTGSQCIQYFPNFAKAYEYVAKVYLDLERPEDLDKVLSDAAQNNVKSAVLEAYAYQKQKKPMEAGLLDRKLKKFRKEFRAHVEKGELAFYDQGLPILTEYLYNCPDSYMFVERGIFHRAAHHYREAREDFEKAAAMSPANPYALNGLSFVCKYTGDFEKALFFMKRAVLYMDEDMSPVIYADMGNLYSLLGDYEMALASYRQYEALAGEKRPAWFYDNMAEIQAKLGNTQEALALYEKACEQDRFAFLEKSTGLYAGIGINDEARLKTWKNTLRNSGDRGKRSSREARLAYLRGAGWAGLETGSKRKSLYLLTKALRYCQEEELGGALGDLVFACMLWQEDRKGKKYGKKLRDWLRREKFSGRSAYFNRGKAYLQLEFLAACYLEPEDKLQEILDRERDCEICHFCTCCVCKEMEGVRIAYLLRTGRREEAGERLKRNLELQPWDEYMQAVKHVAFQDQLQ